MFCRYYYYRPVVLVLAMYSLLFSTHQSYRYLCYQRPTSIHITAVQSLGGHRLQSATIMSGAAAANETAEEQPGGAQMLVSEFPPPPFYYKASASLTPPEIPHAVIRRGTQRAAAAAQKARSESERLRLQQDMPNTDAILGGVQGDSAADDGGDVVAVFGQIVEVSRFGCAAIGHLGQR
jgi:hypothetical protein